MVKSFPLRNWFVILVLLLAVEFFLGDPLVLQTGTVGSRGVLPWKQTYKVAAPAWARDDRLVSDALERYYGWGRAEGIWVDAKMVLYPTDDVWTQKEHYSCSARLQYGDGSFTMRVKSYPWEAREKCLQWAATRNFRVYSGTITVEGDQKVILLKRDRDFKPEIILVPPEE